MDIFLTTGTVALVLILAAVLTVPTSLLMLWLYNRAVLAGMRHHGSVYEAAPAPDEPERRPTAHDDDLILDVVEADRGSGLASGAAAVYRRATGGPRGAARAYGLAGLAYAMTTPRR